MSDRGAVAYLYDGTYEGLMTCVFESFDRKELPDMILSPESTQVTLLPAREIVTDLEKAARVDASISQKISLPADELVNLGYLTCLPDKELVILKFLRLGFHHGRIVTDMLANDTVNTLYKAVQHLTHEAHLLTGFLRFSVTKGALTAVIEPKNQVLPLMTAHFCNRYPNEVFLIYDKTHGMALIHQNGRKEILPVEDLQLPDPDEEEREYRLLWKSFYRTIAIKERENPRCRMTHMPKRYWKYLTEFQEVPQSASRRIQTDSGLSLS